MKKILEQQKSPMISEKIPRTSILRSPGPFAAESSRKASKIKSILVALDFSPASMKALNYAVSLAKKLNAFVHLVHVQPRDDASALAMGGHLKLEPANAMTFFRRKLTGIQRKYVPSSPPQNSHLRTGRPYQEICDLAHEIKADLIILATRGNTGLKRILLGSTTERVVRFATCPVLVVRQRKGKLRGTGPQRRSASREFKVRKILVPMDFSNCALAGLIYAASLAKQFDARLRLFHALFPLNPAIMEWVSANVSKELEAERINAELELEALLKVNLLRDVECETKISSGYPIDQICGEANRPDIDLVITSTHGRTGFEHALIGSVAEQVVRYVDCPVLVVPSRFDVIS
jgi:nucleotide-binding universal stress UspA family protein